MKSLKRIISILCLFSVTGCNEKVESEYSEEFVEIEVQHDYHEVSDIELLWETMFDVDLSSFYVYIYSTTCNHCNDLKNYIIPKALENKNIYFVRGSSKDQIGTSEKMIKNAENPGDIWILGYPSLLLIKDHKCIKTLSGVNQIKNELK